MTGKRSPARRTGWSGEFTRLADTVTMPMLLKTVQSRKSGPRLLIAHHFKLDGILDAYVSGERRALPPRVIIDG